MTDAVARAMCAVEHRQAGVAHAVAYAIGEVHDESVRLRALGERDAVNGIAPGRGDLRVDVFGEVTVSNFLVRSEVDAVISRAHLFVLVAVGSGQSLAAVVERTGGGHDGHIAEVGAARAAEMCLGEAYNLGAAFMVTGAPVPAFFQLGGTGVDHAEGHVGADEDMAVVTGTDARIYVLGQGLRCSHPWKGAQQSKG